MDHLVIASIALRSQRRLSSIRDVQLLRGLEGNAKELIDDDFLATVGRTYREAMGERSIRTLAALNTLVVEMMAHHAPRFTGVEREAWDRYRSDLESYITEFRAGTHANDLTHEEIAAAAPDLGATVPLDDIAAAASRQLIDEMYESALTVVRLCDDIVGEPPAPVDRDLVALVLATMRGD